MPQRIKTVLIVVCALGSAACEEARLDPCQFLSVDDVRAVDVSVSTPVWAGRLEPRAEYEVCTFHNASGDARVMLFVWYGNETPPRDLVAEGSESNDSIRPISETGLEGFASFGNDSLQLLAARSSQRTVGVRVRAPIREGSREFARVVALAEAAVRH